MFWGSYLRLTADFLSETTEAKTYEDNIFKELNEKDGNTRSPMWQNYLPKIKGKLRHFHISKN